MKKISSAVVILCLFCLFASICLFSGCTKKRPLEFTLEEDLSIGVESGDEQYVFAGVDNIALDSEENIYILDGMNFRIQKFDKDGNFLMSLEIKKGEGPKEVTYVTGLAVTGKGKIYVHDRNSMKILIFDEGGQFIHSFKIEFRAMNIIPHSEEKVIVLGSKDDNILHVFSREGKLLHSFGKSFEIPAKYSKYSNFPFLELPARAYKSRSGKIYIVNPHEYKISVYKENEAIGIIKRESESFSPATVTESTDGKINFRFPGATVLEHKNRLYVTLQGPDPDAPDHLEIFEKDKYIASLEVKGLAFAVDRKGRLYYAVEEDFPKLVRYTVREKTPK
jgi:hypothetical protein